MSHVFIGSDHAGLQLKEQLIEHLTAMGHSIEDMGTHSKASCDYPLFAEAVCKGVLAHPESFGILVCGTGIGMSMAANRHPGIRAALCACEFQARATREHNNANVLCLGERVTGVAIALEMARLFLETPFEGGRHLRRIELFDN